MTLLRALLVCLMFVEPAVAASSPAVDARMNAYFAVWSDNARVTQAEVGRLYASQVNYYGRIMNRAQVLQAKLSIVRQWPHRKYSVAPGTVARRCGKDDCYIDLVLNWEVSDPSGRSGSSGATTVSLTLVKAEGAFKIAAENGTRLAR